VTFSLRNVLGGVLDDEAGLLAVSFLLFVLRFG
jgi:hypothetical protein